MPAPVALPGAPGLQGLKRALAELSQVVTGTAYAEAALLRQWVLTDMQQFRVAEAIRAYQKGQVDLGRAAERAQLPVAVFLEELAARRVAVLEDPDAFGSGGDTLRETFGAEQGEVSQEQK